MNNKRKPNITQNNVSVSETKKPEIAVAKTETVKTTPKGKAKESGIGFLFDKRNYILIIAGMLLIALGFILMAGGGSTDPKVFNPDIFNSQRLTVAPILILLGFAVEVLAIMLKPKSQAE